MKGSGNLMLKKSTFIKIISFLSAIIVVAVGFVIKEKSKNGKYALMLQNEYARSFEQLNSSLNNISLALEKSIYVTSPNMMNTLSREIFSEAELAKNALSDLPLGDNGLSTVYRFLSQVGNYSLSVSKSMSGGVSDLQRQTLKDLSNTAKTVSEVISNTDIEYNNAESWAKSVESRLNDIDYGDGLATSLTELEENLTDYPTLIYDGPYSDHILNKQPLMTSNAKVFSQDEAEDVVKRVLGANSQIEFNDVQNGKIECYRFGNSGVDISVSKAGGYVVYMRKNRNVYDSKLSYEQAVAAAVNFLFDMGFKNLVDTYYFTDNGICVINFAYLDGQTICYTDLIKVGVAMDTGEIMLIETSGYLTNHTHRAFEIPSHTEEEAREQVSSELTIEKSAITLIPTDSGGEVRCYEFLCRNEENREILVYVNVKTLEQEQLYIVLKTDGGTLVK